jgi:hypothetical protein
MDTRLQIVSVLGAAALLLVVLELVRRRRLLERYALVWLASAAAVLLLAIFSGSLGWLAEMFGIQSGPNALFFVALGFVLLLLLNFSVAVSRLTDQSKILAQRQAILEERVRELEDDPPPAQAGSGEDAPATVSRAHARSH